MKNIIILTIISLCLVISVGQSNAQDELTILIPTPKDSLEVRLFKGETLPSGAIPYNYLPLHLRLSERDEYHEFSFFSYSGDNGEIKGSILHFLLVWGLDNEQRSYINQFLTKEVDSLAFLNRSIANCISDDHLISITSDNELGEMLGNSLNSQSGIAYQEGTKSAMSFKLNAETTLRMQQELEQPEAIKNIWLTVNMECSTPKGEIIQIELKDNLYHIFNPIIISKNH